MTILTTSRKKLDDALARQGNTLLLVSDETGDDAENVHDKAEAVARSWQSAFLIRDLALLSPAERSRWFSEGGHYAVVGGTQKVVALRGPLSDLLLSNAKPSGIEIRWAFAQGDLLP